MDALYSLKTSIGVHLSGRLWEWSIIESRSRKGKGSETKYWKSFRGAIKARIGFVEHWPQMDRRLVSLALTLCIRVTRFRFVLPSMSYLPTPNPSPFPILLPFPQLPSMDLTCKRRKRTGKSLVQSPLVYGKRQAAGWNLLFAFQIISSQAIEVGWFDSEHSGFSPSKHRINTARLVKELS